MVKWSTGNVALLVYISLFSALVGFGWTRPLPGRFFHKTETQYPFYRRVGGLQTHSGQVRKISTPLAFDSPNRIIVAIPIDLSWHTAVSKPTYYY
jgi:hypothetical protein